MIEDLLHANWSWDALALYADELTSKGDPRGEVIAIDLLPHPERPAWWERRRAVLARWLGDEDAKLFGHLIQHGFVHELRDGPLAGRVLLSPLGEFVRGLSTWGTQRADLRLVQLEAAPRPWLTRTTVKRWGPGNKCTAGADVDFEWILDVIEATPDVNQLYKHYDVLDEPLHVLLPRLAAAGHITLDGPTAKRNAIGASRATMPRLPYHYYGREMLHAFSDDQAGISLGRVDSHIQMLSAAFTTPLPESMHRAIEAYLRDLAAKPWHPMLSPNRFVAFSTAVHGLLEAQALRGWCDAGVEDFAAVLASTLRNDVSLRLHYEAWDA